MNKRLVRIIAIAAIVVGAISFAARLMFPARFDIARWQSADSGAQYFARRDMMGDVYRLFDNHTLHDRQIVLRYLGRPQKGDAQAGNVWLYDLGERPDVTAPSPHDWLEVIFTPAGQVASHRITQDPSDLK